MKIDKFNVHQPAESLPPAVPSHTSAAVEEISREEEDCEDDEFWSEFCEAEVGSTSKQPLAELEKPGDYCLEQEDFFSDDMAPPFDDSYEMSYNGYQPDRKILHSKEDLTADSNSKRAYINANSRFPFRYYKAENALEDVVDIEEQISEDKPVFLKKRKRMIDEILNVEIEKSANASTKPSSLIPKSYAAASSVNRLCTTEVGGLEYASSSRKTSVQSRQVSLPQKTNFKPSWCAWMSSSGTAPVKTLPAGCNTHFKENISPLQESLPPAILCSTPSTSTCMKASFPPVSSYSHQSMCSPLKAGVPGVVSSSLSTWEHFQSGRGEPQREPSVAEQASKHVPYAPVPAACSFFTAGTVYV